MQKLAELCIRRPVFATMLIVSLLVLGATGYSKPGVDRFPKVEIPTVTVTVALPGASPEEVETTVTKKVEETVNTVSGIDELRSVSAEGMSQVFISFELEKDADIAAQEVRDKVNRILRDLPEDSDPPVIEKLDPDAAPILSIVIAGSQSLREITKRVDDLVKKNIESLAGVGQVRFIGDRRRQIQVVVEAQKLSAYGLNIDQIRAALKAQNVEIPGGRVDRGARELILRTMGRIVTPRQFADVIVANINGTPVRISDLGQVSDGVEEARTIARLNGRSAVVLEVRKQSGTDTVEVIRSVKQRVGELESSLPPDYSIEFTRDQSNFIEASFHAVRGHLILGGLLAALIVFLFIRNLRPTLIAAVAIPTSIIATFALMNFMGFTLNDITMLALTLVVGIVIDDAIVVLENVYRFMEEKGLSPREAAIEGTRDVGLAVMTTTLSLVIVFLPVAYMGGIVGRFMSSFGFTATFAILVSLLVSFTLTPMLCSRFLKTGTRSRRPHEGSRERGFYPYLLKGYTSMLRWCLNHRMVVSAASLVLVLTTVPLFVAVGKDFLPQDDQSEFEINVRTPPGSSPRGTLQLMIQMEAEVAQLPYLRSSLTTVGADSQQRADRGSILVELVDVQERDLSQQEIMKSVRDKLVSLFPELEVSVVPPAAISGGGFVNADLQFLIQGPDLDQLNRVSTRLQHRLKETPGVVDVDSTFEPGKPELRAYVKREKASDLGVSVNSIAAALRTLVGGDEQATTYREGDERYDVLLRVDEANRTTAEGIARLYVPSLTLGNVPLANVVRLETGTGPSQIDRYNRQRQVTLTANILKGQSLSNVIQVLNQEVASLQLPSTVRTGLLGRSRELGRSARAYLIALILSLAFMYIVMAALFESFVDPITVMSTLPLSVPFALLPLWLLGENFSIIYSSLGILMLFGVVKKNAILQIDHVNALRRQEGKARRNAILEACADRLRPILMTTLSLVAGMLPLALGSGAGAGSRRSVAIIIIGGQMLCLLLTLLVAPVVYTLLEDFVRSKRWSRLRSLFSILTAPPGRTAP
ncbi:MAG: efflux RND transporter permease subunit [Acidobacteriota bacterium]